MSISVTIKHDGEADASARVAVTVVTVGDLQAPETKHVLSSGEEVKVQVNKGQFVMVDESDKE